jgi:hypothetical protein
MLATCSATNRSPLYVHSATEIVVVKCSSLCRLWPSRFALQVE